MWRLVLSWQLALGAVGLALLLMPTTRRPFITWVEGSWWRAPLAFGASMAIVDSLFLPPVPAALFGLVAGALLAVIRSGRSLVGRR